MRFGRNVASYKFALGQALLDLGARQQTFVRLEDLAVPYAVAICEHLQVEDRQSTSAQSQFLDACRSPPGLESRPGLLRVQLRQTRPPSRRGLDAVAGTAR